MSKKDAKLANEVDNAEVIDDNITEKNDLQPTDLNVDGIATVVTCATPTDLANELSKLRSALADILLVQTKVLDELSSVANPELLANIHHIRSDIETIKDLQVDAYEKEGTNKFDLSEVSTLIGIKSHLYTVRENAYAERQYVNAASSMIPSVESKIMSLLLSDGFKEYINYADPKKAKGNT